MGKKGMKFTIRKKHAVIKPTVLKNNVAPEKKEMVVLDLCPSDMTINPMEPIERNTIPMDPPEFQSVQATRTVHLTCIREMLPSVSHFTVLVDAELMVFHYRLLHCIAYDAKASTVSWQYGSDTHTTYVLPLQVPYSGVLSRLLSCTQFPIA